MLPVFLWLKCMDAVLDRASEHELLSILDGIVAEEHAQTALIYTSMSSKEIHEA